MKKIVIVLIDTRCFLASESLVKGGYAGSFDYEFATPDTRIFEIKR